MNKNRITVFLTSIALLSVPTLALAGKPTDNPGKGKGPVKTETTPKGKAYGKHCSAESKKHVAGEKGTAFSRCVNAMAKADKGASPKAACKSLSKKHVKGEKGTPYSRCVVAAAQVKKEAGYTS